jgi:hypothetical protein
LVGDGIGQWERDILDLDAEQMEGRLLRTPVERGLHGVTVATPDGRIVHRLDDASDLELPLLPSRPVTMLWTRIRGSRRRSEAFIERHIIESHRSPSQISGSTGLLRGDPSARIVATSTTSGASSRSRPSSARRAEDVSNSCQRVRNPSSAKEWATPRRAGKWSASCH